MDKELFHNQWGILKEKVKEHWDKLTDKDITKIDGKLDILFGLLETKYGYTKERAKEEFKIFGEKMEKEFKAELLGHFGKHI